MNSRHLYMALGDAGGGKIICEGSHIDTSGNLEVTNYTAQQCYEAADCCSSQLGRVTNAALHGNILGPMCPDRLMIEDRFGENSGRSRFVSHCFRGKFCRFRHGKCEHTGPIAFGAQDPMPALPVDKGIQGKWEHEQMTRPVMGF